MRTKLLLGGAITLLVLAGLLWVVSSYALGLRDDLRDLSQDLANLEESIERAQQATSYLHGEVQKTSANLVRVNREFGSLGVSDEKIREHINLAVPAQLSRLLNEARTRVPNPIPSVDQSESSGASNL